MLGVKLFYVSVAERLAYQRDAASTQPYNALSSSTTNMPCSSTKRACPWSMDTSNAREGSVETHVHLDACVGDVGVKKIPTDIPYEG